MDKSKTAAGDSQPGDEAAALAAYRAGSADEPPPHIDAAVLRAAREALPRTGDSPPKVTPFWGQWLKPMSTVVAMGACLAVVIAIMQSAPVVMAPAPEVADAASASSDSAQLSQVRRKQRPAAALVSPSARKQLNESIQPDKPVPASAAIAGMGAMAAGGAEARTVLVLGGTGRLGAEIIKLLDQDTFPVTVFARPDSNRDRLLGLDVAYVTGDLLKRDSVIAALSGEQFSYVIDASARRNYAGKFYEIAMENLLAGLQQSDVEQFILHGSIGAGDSASVFSDGLSARMRDIMEDKTAAERLLKSSGIPYTIIRNGIIKPYGTPLTGTAELTGNTQTMGSITRQDLAELTLECLAEPACLNTTLHAIDPRWADD